MKAVRPTIASDDIGRISQHVKKGEGRAGRLSKDIFTAMRIKYI
jgi:hypothetical protein